MNNPQFTYRSTTFSPASLFHKLRRTVLTTTLPFQLDMLKSTGRYDAFDLKWHPTYGDMAPGGYPTLRHLFWDSDVGKWIEGVMYFLLEEEEANGEDLHELRSAVNELVGKIETAQQEDGYLNIHYQVVEKGKRWTNLRDMHEMYNAGHLIEAAAVHAWGSDKRLLEVMERYVALIAKHFGPGADQRHGYPGHPEIELALIRLYKSTSNKLYLDLAKFFLEERGNPDPHYYDVEAKERGERPNERPGSWPERRAFWYQQAHVPLLEQETVEGHSVRVMYLLTAAADLATIDSDFRVRYMPALERLWNNTVGKKMYLTGGVGAIDQWEGFGINYFLPQATDEGGCYSETCAGIGVMMWANRMLQLDLNRKYSDILELCLYNCVMTGMSTDGKAFTYVNQLASSPGEPSVRYEWFDCACCPPNMARTLGFLGGYFWDFKETVKDPSDMGMAYELDFDYVEAEPSVEINVHLYSSCTLTQKLADNSTLRLEQKTEWPWNGNVEFHLETTTNENVTIRLRIPSWANEYKIEPKLPYEHIEKGYLTLSPEYLKQNPHFRFSVPVLPRLIKPHPYTNQPIVAIARGPVVYCLEDVDNPWVDDHFKSLIFHPPQIPSSSSSSTSSLHLLPRSDLPHSTSYISISAPRSGSFLPKTVTTDPSSADEPSPFYSVSVDNQAQKQGKQKEKVKEKLVDLLFIPYYARANRRGKGMMRVGLRCAAAANGGGTGTGTGAGAGVRGFM